MTIKKLFSLPGGRLGKLFALLPFWKHLTKKQRLYFQMGLGALLVVLVPLAVVTLRQPGKAAASWFNESWLYRQSVAITNSSGSNQTNFQVSFTLDTAALITAGKMQGNCNDLRLTDINSQSIPYWIEENNPGCNSATTKVWTKVPSISTSGTTVYVYYGNPSAGSGQVPSKVFDFFDDFNGTGVSGAWARAGNPIVSGGSATLATSSALISKGIVSNTTIQETVGFRMKTSTTSASVVRAGFSDNNNPSTGFATADSAHVLIGSESTYQTSISPSSLVSYHQLEETTTTDANQFKASGYLDTGKLSQAASVYGNAAGTSGSILTFNRGTQISGRNYERFNTNQGTISLWVKPSWNGNDGVEHDLLCSGNDCNVWFYKSTGNNLIFGVWDNTGGTYRSASVSISGWTSGTWYHVLARWDGDNVVSGSNYVELYINGSNTGVTNGTTANSNAISPGKNNAIGARPDGSKSAQALIDDFAIFDRVLTTTEISNIYNSGTGREAGYVADSSLKFYAKMDGSGTLSPVTYNAGAAFDQTAYNSSTNTNGNLVADGNMETVGVTNWNMANPNVNISSDITKSTSTVGFDTQSLRINTNGLVNGAASQTVSVSANTTYVYSYYCNGTVYPRVRAVDSGAVLYNPGSTTCSGWQRQETVIKTSASTTQLYLEFAQSGDVTYYIDNVFLTPNSVDNGGMEGTKEGSDPYYPPSWANWQAEAGETDVVSSDKHSGSQSVHVAADAASEGVYAQDFKSLLTAGASYLVTGWFKRVSGSINFMVWGPTTTTFGSTTITSGATNWTKFSFVFKTGSTIPDAYVALYAGSSGGAAEFYVDDVSIIPLDNTALSFQSWAPVDDSGSAQNDMSVQGDSDGVSSTVSQWTNAYNFDGATGYLRQKVYDTNIDTLTYADTNTDISDTGQEFGDWDNDSGAAEYMIVVTNSDNTTSWGYFCANDGGTQTAVYTLKACTGGSEGFNGTSPSGKTPVGYEIRKTDYQNFGNAFTVGAWAYFDAIDDVKPVVAKWGTPAGGHSNKSFLLGAVSNNFSLQMAKDGVTDTCSADAAGSTGSWVFLVGTYDGTNVRLYKNGSLAATSSTCSGTIYDGAADFEVGSTTNWWDGKRVFDGNIDSPFVTNTALSADQIMALYSAKQNFGLANTHSGSYGFGTSATALNTDYHTFEITQTDSSAIFSEDGGAGITSSTNSPTTSQYVRLENTDSTNLAYVDYVYVRKYAATAPVVGSPASEEKGPGPIAYWKFDEGQGAVAKDSTSSKNNSTFINNASWQTEDQCISGKCVKMPADTDYLRLTASAGNVLNLGSSDFTIMGWLKVFQPETYGSGLLGNYPHDGNNGDLSIGISDDRTSLFLNHRNTSGTYESYGGFNYSSYFGQWVQMSWVKSGSSLYLYLNGEKKKTWDITISFDVDFYDDYWYIGNTGWSPGTMSNLMVDEHKIYNYARTAAEIKTDYNAGKANASTHSGTGFAAGSSPQDWLSNGLVGYWKMDETSGTAVTDTSGNGNTGTLASAQETGTATAEGTTTTLIDTDSASLSTTDDAYNEAILYITGQSGGTCAILGSNTGTARLISDYDGTNKIITVTPAFSAVTQYCTYEIRHQTGGKYGQTLRFDGVNDTVSVTDPSSGVLDFDTNNFSYGLWVNFDTNGDAPDVNWQLPFWKGGASVNSAGYDIEFSETGNKIWANISDGGGGAAGDDMVQPSYSYSFRDSRWHHVFVTVDRLQNKMTLFVDGDPKESLTIPSTLGSISNSSDLTFSTSGYPFDGKLDEVRVYNRSLSPQEVRQLADWAPGPVGYYKLDDKVSGNSKTLVDSSGFGNNLTTYYGSNATGMSCTKVGKYGGACEFDGTDDYASDTSVTGIYDAPFTMEAWVYPLSSTGDKYLIEYGVSGGAPDFLLRINNGNWNYVTNGINSLSATTGVTLNKWTHVAATMDNDFLVSIYINGVLEGTKTIKESHAAPDNSNDRFYIASRTASNYFQGMLDEVKIYNYARSAKQIVEDMNAGHPAVGGAPVGAPLGHWKFDEGQGQTANNSGSQGSALNGTLGADSSSSTDDPSWSQAGKFGKALSFDGGDYVDVGTGVSLPTGQPFTVSAWINRTSGSGNYPIGWYQGTNGFLMYDDGTARVATAGTNYTTTTTLNTTSSWNQIVMIFDGTNLKTYHNGVAKDSITASYTKEGTGSLHIGNLDYSSGQTGYFNGLIDDVKIYNYALTADEVKTEYNHGSSLSLGSLSNTSSLTGGSVASNSASAEYCIPGDTATCSAPVGRWDFEEGKDNTCSGGANDVCDKSGNGNDGAWNGTGSHWAAGKTGKAGRFNGSDDQVALGAGKFDTYSNATVEMWFKYTGSFDTNRVLFYRYKDGNNRMPIFVSYSGGYGNKLVYENIVASSNRAVTSNNVIATNTWYHAAFTCGTGGMQMYINGVKQSSTNATTDCFSLIAATTSNDISSGNFQGIIDQVTVYDYVRTPAQVAYDYNRGGPVGWWKMDECQGATAYDSSGNKNNGTITIGASGEDTLGTCTTSSTAWGSGATGKRNASLSFDGTDDYIDAGTGTSLSISGNLTVSVWVKTTADAPSSMHGFMSIINKSASDGSSMNYSLIMYTANKAGFYVDGSNLALTKTAINDGGWHHLVGIYNGSASIYLDGVLQNSLASSAPTQSAYSVTIGSRQSGTARFNGQIDDAKIFNYALTPTQVRDVYNGGAVNFAPATGAP